MDLFNAKIVYEEDGLYCISLVNEAAVDVDFQMFSKEKEEDSRKMLFSVQGNEEEHKLFGCIMRADYNIYRKDGDYEYLLRYDKATIEEMSKRMLANHCFNNFSLDHDGWMLPAGSVQMIACFQKDTDKGISPVGFEHIADGSLFGLFKVNDDNLWQNCKDGIFNGFSLEGYFTVEQQKKTEELEKNKTIMSKIKDLFKKVLADFGSAKTNKGDIYYEGDTLEVGKEVADETGAPIEDGEYEVDGKIITVKDGKIESISDQKPEPEPEPDTATQAAIDDLKGQIDALQATVDALKAMIDENINKPAAKGVEEQFEKVKTTSKSTAVDYIREALNR